MARLTKQQIDAIRDAHAVLDELAVLPPGSPDTAQAREARAKRSALEEAFADAFAPEPPAAEIARA